jgi:cysteine desulfurase/selenocysteine lyase
MTTAMIAPQTTYDVEARRRDFPILATSVSGRPLVYLDNAASSQKPTQVLDAITGYYREKHSNVHRGVHYLAQRATEAYEAARDTVAAHMGARDRREVVFVRGTTEAINLVAQSYARPRLQIGDEIVITQLEHHSNIVPWQMVCEQTGARLVVAPLDEHGQLRLEAFADCLGPRTRMVSLAHVSNALGTILPVAEVVRLAHAQGAVVMVDGAQAAPHMKLDVAALDCDFYAVSAHKAYGPTGIGALWGRRELLDAMPPYQGGGEMIRRVTFAKTEFADSPARFEAGTPNIAGAVGMAAALDYLNAVGLEAIHQHEADLLAYAAESLAEVPGVIPIGTAPDKASVLSFLVEGIHAHDVGTILDSQGVAVRVGHHCAQPLMDSLGIAATARASLGLYNTRREIDALVEGLDRVRELFA